MDSIERALFEMSSSSDEDKQAAGTDVYVHTAVALFDYEGVEVDELSFLRGDRIVIYGTPEEDWYEGELNNRIGMIPANYVRLLPRHHSSSDEESSTFSLIEGEDHASHLGSSLLESIASESWGVNEVSNGVSHDKDIHDRLYDEGVTHVKRQQFQQEMSRNKVREEMQHKQFKAGAKSKKMAVNRKPDAGNYGEFLYNEGVAKQQKRAEMSRMKKEQEALQETESTFTPKICRYSKSMRRDMPVVDRLLMLEQVKVEKLEAMKKEKAKKEAKEYTVTPPPTTWNFNTPRSTVSGNEHEHTIQRVRREMLKERIDRELGRTFTPQICPRSKQIANSVQKSRRSDTNDVFNRLHRDGERNAMRLEVKKIEASLTALDLADGGRLIKPKAKSPSGSTTDNANPPLTAVERSNMMYERAKVKRLQSELLDRQRQEMEKERRTPSKAPKSETLSRDKLRRECRSVLEAYAIIVEGSASENVSFAVWEHMVRDLVGPTLIGHDVAATPEDEEKVVLGRMWKEVLETQGADDMISLSASQDGACPAEELAEMVLLIHEGETFDIAEREPVAVGKAALTALQGLAKSVMLKRLGNKPMHMMKLEKKGLEQRLQNLTTQAGMEFAKIASDIGLKTNEAENRELFRFYNEQDNSINYARFALQSTAILSPRRRAIERVLKRYDMNGDGSVSVKDLVEDHVRRHGEMFLIKTTEKILDVRKRLMRTVKHLPSSDPFDDAQTSSTINTPRSSRKAVSETSGEFMLFDSQELMQRSDPTGGLGIDGPYSEMPRYEYLHQLSRRRLESTFEMRRKLDEKEMEHCTFKPLINTTERKGDKPSTPIGERLFQTAKEKLEKTPDKGSFIPTWELRELEECTFHPKINKNPPVFTGNRSIRRSRKSAEPQFANMGPSPEILGPTFGRDPSFVPEDTPRSSRGDFDTDRSTQPIAPTFHMDQRQRERIPPALYVDINLGPGKVGRIGLHQGDDPSVLAENFCKTYSLNETTKAKLTGMLRQQLDMITVDM